MAQLEVSLGLLSLEAPTVCCTHVAVFVSHTWLSGTRMGESCLRGNLSPMRSPTPKPFFFLNFLKNSITRERKHVAKRE